MRDINFLTWNTQLYEMGNKLSKNSPVKQIDTQIFDGVVEEVKDFLDKKTNAVAILQEIPFKCNTDSFNTHKLFTKFIEIFPEKASNTCRAYLCLVAELILPRDSNRSISALKPSSIVIPTERVGFESNNVSKFTGISNASSL